MPPGKDIITNRYSNRENGWCSNKKNYPAEALETLVGQSFADTLQYETWVEFVNKTYERQIEDLRKLHRSDPHKTKESLVKRIGALEKKISRARELFINGDLPRPEYVDKKFGIQDKIEVVRQELSKLGDFDSAMERLELQRNLLMALAPDPFGQPKIHFNGDPDDPDAEAFIDDYSMFTDRGGETSRTVPDGGKRRASEYRQEFYRKMDLQVSVGGDIVISLDIGRSPVSKCVNSS
jgi:hypothetical protein